MKYFTSKINSQNFLKFFVFILFLILIIRFFESRLYLSDLKVYYQATRTLMHWPLSQSSSPFMSPSDFNPYHFAYGEPSGFYKYAPFFLILFSLFAKIPWSVLIFLYPLFNLCLLVFFFKTIEFLFTNYFSLNTNKDKYYLDKALLLSLILQTHNIYREILIGNINIFIMLLLSCFLISYLAKRVFLSSFLLAFFILIKPHFIFIAVLLVLFKNYKHIVVTSLCGAFFLLIPVVFFGPTYSLELTRSWIQAIQSHNNMMAYIQNPIDIQYVFWQFLSLFKYNIANYNLSVFVHVFIITVPFFIYFILMLSSFRRQRSKTRSPLSQEKFIIGSFALSAIIPFILLVDSNQLLYTFPFCVYLFYSAFSNLKDKIQVRTFALFFIFTLAFVFAILTQQIPRDWLPFHNFIGAAYILLFFISSRLMNQRKKNLSYLDF